MYTTKYRNSIEVGSLPIRSVDYHFDVSALLLVVIHPLSREYGINGFLTVILNSLQTAYRISTLSLD